jgi:anaerobic ribonucleoside-triphosphate reductase activating protein
MMRLKLRIAGYTKESVVDGPGIRFVVYAQGCPHRCEGCHNPETWDFGGGKEISEDDLVSLISDTRLLSGVTFSGGEPFSQAKEFASLAKRVKSLGLDIVTRGSSFPLTGALITSSWNKRAPLASVVITNSPI